MTTSLTTAAKRNKPGAGGFGFRLDASAVLVVNELEEEKMEEDDEEREGGPEEGRQSAEGVAVFMKSDDVLQKENPNISIIAVRDKSRENTSYLLVRRSYARKNINIVSFKFRNFTTRCADLPSATSWTWIVCFKFSMCCLSLVM